VLSGSPAATARALAALVAALVMIVCGDVPQENAVTAMSRAGDVHVFEPGTLTVAVGASVRWINARDVFHTVTSSDAPGLRVPNGAFAGSLAKRGDAFAHRFSVPGMYHYYCSVHPDMSGTINVR
jgi:plastocyanin